MTLKTRLLLWINRHWPRIEQWAISHCDMMPPDYEPFKETLNKLSINPSNGVCLACGYEVGEFEGLYRGYGCPECHSPLVVISTESKEN